MCFFNMKKMEQKENNLKTTRPDKTITAELEGSYWQLGNNMAFDWKRYAIDLEKYTNEIEEPLKQK